MITVLKMCTEKNKITAENPGPPLPETVTLIEVGPRDGFQSEKKIIPTPLKIDIISGLSAAGFKMIQVGSFVSPRRVPQMADTDRLPGLLEPIPGVTYNYLVLNRAGFDRAVGSGAASLEISVSASNTHSRKNTGISRDNAIAEAIRMAGDAVKHGLHVRASIQCAFGCVYEGRIDPAFVVATSRKFLSMKPNMLVLADTTGMATPASVTSLLKDLLPISGDTPVALHLHDTRGLGLSNVRAAIECGVLHFDTALSGMGGCPFIPGAPGNISTEKTLSMLAQMNINTGIDLEAVVRCSERLKSHLTGH